MAFTKKIKGFWKDDKVNLNNAFSYLKRNLTAFKTNRISEWESFRDKFNEDMEQLEKSEKKRNSIQN